MDLGERQRATMWEGTKPAKALSTAWLETTSATALAACWRMDASEDSTICDQPRVFPTKCGHSRSRDLAAFEKLDQAAVAKQVRRRQRPHLKEFDEAVLSRKLNNCERSTTLWTSTLAA